jgi:hypothetical protein
MELALWMGLCCRKVSGPLGNRAGAAPPSVLVLITTTGPAYNLCLRFSDKFPDKSLTVKVMLVKIPGYFKIYPMESKIL